MGKRTSFEDFRQMKHRGGRGVACQKITEKTGKLATVITVAEDDDIMLITNEGTIIRTSVQNINVYSRSAAGVIIMRLQEGSVINNVARLEKDENIEKESLEVEKESALHPVNISEGKGEDTAEEEDSEDDVIEEISDADSDEVEE
jgi:DNA gyrase subunit A